MRLAWVDKVNWRYTDVCSYAVDIDGVKLSAVDIDGVKLINSKRSC